MLPPIACCILMVFPIPVTDNSILSVAQAKNHGVIFETSLFSHPISNSSVNTIAFTSKNSQNLTISHHLRCYCLLISNPASSLHLLLPLTTLFSTSKQTDPFKNIRYFIPLFNTLQWFPIIL